MQSVLHLFFSFLRKGSRAWYYILAFQIVLRLRQEDYQLRLCSKTFSEKCNAKYKSNYNKPGVVVHAYNSRYLGSQGRRLPGNLMSPVSKQKVKRAWDGILCFPLIVKVVNCMHMHFVKIWKIKELLSADSTGNDSPSLNKNYWKLSVCPKPCCWSQQSQARWNHHTKVPDHQAETKAL